MDCPMNWSLRRPHLTARRGFLATVAALSSVTMLGSLFRPQRHRDTHAVVQSQAADLRQRFPDIPAVTPIDLREWLESQASKIILIDVRSSHEQAVSMIPQARPLSEIALDDLDRSSILVPYCTIGYRSARVARELRREWSAVFNLDGGLLAWCHAGLPVQDRVGATRKVHVYGIDWNLLPPGYEAVW
jgi:rhodanese-related sulfurtransferase